MRQFKLLTEQIIQANSKKEAVPGIPRVRVLTKDFPRLKRMRARKKSCPIDLFL